MTHPDEPSPHIPRRLTRRELLGASALGGVTGLLAGCGSSASAAPAPLSVSAAALGPLADPVQAHLLLLRDAVQAIIDPITGAPTTIPQFDQIFAGAGRLDSVSQPVLNASVIVGLLGRAEDFDCEPPSPTYTLEFPRDHHFHPRMGVEWYYVALVLQVNDPAGTPGRIGVLVDLNKERIIGLTTQQRFGLSDEASILFSNTVTATVDFPNSQRLIRRRINAQWPAAGGSAGFSRPGQSFRLFCGPDSLTGPADVLPLAVDVQDGTNLTVSLTLKPPAGFSPENAFFFQGLPNNLGIGTGLTGLPTPGLYYSWPQLVVDTTTPPTLVVDGVTYTVRSGVGWMDHQVLMQSLQNPGAATSPIPFTDDTRPISGWCWQYFNLTNGDAFTGSAFQNWFLSTNPVFSYGYYVTPMGGRWQAQYLTGGVGLGQFRTFSVNAGIQSSTATVRLPNSWSYINLQGPPGVSVQGTGRPWFSDGTFNFPDLEIIAENPVDFVGSGGSTPNGTGFCETVGFESHAQYSQRALDFLR